MIDEVLQIITDTKKDMAERLARLGEDLVAPYPADNPCYYCDRHTYLERTGIDMCDYCIHNADNKLQELIDKAIMRGATTV